METSFFDAVPQDIIEQLSDIDFSLKHTGSEHDVNLLLEKTVLVGGKRLRPLLTLLVGRLCGVPLNNLVAYARVIELLHAASLAHDDVIDNATMRRASASINIVASNKKAVLAGDFLFAEVIISVAKEGNLDLIREVARVIQELSDGEWLQLDIAKERVVSFEQVEKVALKKTASVLTWCSVVGPYLAKIESVEKREKLLELAKNFGKHLGLSFQFVDDTLDFKATGQKDFMLDEENGLLNAVMVEWLELDQEAMRQFTSGEQVVPDISSPLFVAALKKTRERALKHLKLSRKYLDEMTQTLSKDTSEDISAFHKPLTLILEFLSNREY